jgi:hypothetical protein
MSAFRRMLGVTACALLPSLSNDQKEGVVLVRLQPTAEDAPT